MGALEIFFIIIIIIIGGELIYIPLIYILLIGGELIYIPLIYILLIGGELIYIHGWGKKCMADGISCFLVSTVMVHFSSCWAPNPLPAF